MEHFIDWVIRQNIELTILICLILLVRISFKKILAPKAIHLLWLIVLIKSVSYLNVPYVTTKPAEVKSEFNDNSKKIIINQEKSNKREMPQSTLIENEKPSTENINIVGPKKEPVFKTETTTSWFISMINYFTADKIKTILLGFYLLILPVMLIHLLISLMRIRRLESGASQNDLLTNKLQALKAKLKISSKVKIYESSIIPSPTLIGIYSYTILIPTNILGKLSKANLEDVISHELMHIKRKDALVNLAYRLITCFYFYNPFIWIAYFHMKKDMESACDQDVLIKSDFKNNISYAESLLLITKLCKQNGPVNHHAMMFIHKNTFKRIDMITNLKKTGFLSRIVFTSTIIFALIVFVPSYRVVSEETKLVSELDNIVINLENNKFEDSLTILNNQLKKTLGIKNIFVTNDRNFYLNLDSIKFKGTFKQFRELIFKEQKFNTLYFNGNLYFTRIAEKTLLDELERINKFNDTESKIRNSLNSKIQNIVFSHTNLLDAIKKTAKEAGIEIDLTSQCDYHLLLKLKNKKIVESKFNDISAWDLLVSLTYLFDKSCLLELKDGRLFLSEEGWKKNYKDLLQKQIAFEKTEITLQDFLQTIRSKFPEMQVILLKTALDNLGINDQVKIKVSQKNGILENMLKESLNQIKMDFELVDQALVISSKELIEKNKIKNEMSKKLFLTSNKNETNKENDIRVKMETPVFFDYTNTNLKDGLNELSELANISLVYKEGIINEENNFPIQMVANGMSFKNALKWILANSNLDYQISNNSIVIQKKSVIEIPSSIIELSKAIPNLDTAKENKDGKLIVVKPNKDFNLEFERIEAVRIDIVNSDTVPSFEIVSVENNLILVNVTKGILLPGTACTIFYRD